MLELSSLPNLKRAATYLVKARLGEQQTVQSSLDVGSSNNGGTFKATHLVVVNECDGLLNQPCRARLTFLRCKRPGLQLKLKVMGPVTFPRKIHPVEVQ